MADKPNRFVSLGIKNRLIVGFSAMILTMMISVVVILTLIKSTETVAEKYINYKLPSYSYVLDIDKDVHRIQSLVQRWISSNDEKARTENISALKHLESGLVNIDKLIPFWNKDDVSKFTELRGMLTTFVDKNKALMMIDNAKMVNTKDLALINSLSEKINTILRGNDEDNSFTSGGLIGGKYQELVRGNHEIIEDMVAIEKTEYALLFLSIIISILISWHTIRAIIFYINKFREHASKVAGGDFTQRIAIETSDEMGQLGTDLNVMTEKLASITKQTNEMCNNIVALIEEAKRASDNQSAGSVEQASSINQITSSLDEIEKGSSQTLEKAKFLGQSAQETGKKGELGLQAVELSVQGMREVREKVQAIAQTILDLSVQTQQVGEITGVVNTLAQQSKMLALNASIEAAKAGEAGKGFAVVASEVKNLAEQSEQSTSQVQKILEDIRHATEKAVLATEEGTKKVDEGASLAERTGEIVQNLSEMINQSQLAAQQIQASILQENVGIEQITTGMNEINTVTGTFLESIKQSNEALDNLRTIAKNLRAHVETYRF